MKRILFSGILLLAFGSSANADQNLRKFCAQQNGISFEASRKVGKDLLKKINNCAKDLEQGPEVAYHQCLKAAGVPEHVPERNLTPEQRRAVHVCKTQRNADKLEVKGIGRASGGAQ